MDVSDYRDLFIAEAQEYLQTLNEHLLKIEQTPNDRESLDEIFRVMHSLKGMAGTMGYEHITEIAHQLESILEILRSKKAFANPKIIDLLFEALDILQDLLINPENPGTEAVDKAQTLLRGLAEYRSKEAAGEAAGGAPGKAPGEAPGEVPEEVPEEVPAAVQPDAEELTPEQPSEISIPLTSLEKELLRGAAKSGDQIYIIKVVLKEGTLLKSVRVYMVIRAVEGFGEVVSSYPSLQDLDQERFDRDFALLLVGRNIEPEKVKAALIQIAEVESVDLFPYVEQEEGEAPLPAQEEPREAHEPVSEQGEAGRTAVAPADKQQEAVKAETAPKTAEIARRKAGSEGLAPGETVSASVKMAEKTVRVETAKLDDLINLMGELVITRTRVLELGQGYNEDLSRSLEQLDRIITELQSSAMKLRMVPIKQVFDRFPRMVRDISHDRNKEINFIISGESTELDRSIINQIGDPLVHLIRNAIDHGIENREQRLQAGKSAVGTITLKAHHEGSHVVITVSDDGAGMDPAKIGKAAVNKGLITAEEAAKMKEEEILNLVFRTGFSTAAGVDAVSGRGIGLDAVKRIIENMHGTVEIKSEPGKGTRFILRLPLTLAIIKALLVIVGGQTFAIPIEAIRENIYIQADQIKTMQKEWVFNLRDEVIPLISLQKKLKMGEDRGADEYPVVIVEIGEKKAGLIVQGFVGQQEIVIKSLGGYLRDLEGIAGAAVLGDGMVILILDVASLMDDGRVEVGQNSFNY